MARERKILTVSGCLAMAAAMAAVYAVDAANARGRWETTAREIHARYGQAPKGVIMEEELVGLPPISHVAYDARSQRYILNDGAFSYALPVSPADFAVICRSVAAFKNFGVSIKMDKSPFVLPDLDMNRRPMPNTVLERTPIARDLTAADQIFGYTMFATPAFKVQLPRNYQPKIARQRKIWSVVTVKFHGYQVAGVPGGNEFRRANFAFTPILWPTDQYRKTGEGGHLPNRELMAQGIRGESEDIENFNFLHANQREFFAMPAVARAINIGEAVAFARFLRSAGHNLNHIADSLR